LAAAIEINSPPTSPFAAVSVSVVPDSEYPVTVAVESEVPATTGACSSINSWAETLPTCCGFKATLMEQLVTSFPAGLAGIG